MISACCRWLDSGEDDGLTERELESAVAAAEAVKSPPAIDDEEGKIGVQKLFIIYACHY